MGVDLVARFVARPHPFRELMDACSVAEVVQRPLWTAFAGVPLESALGHPLRLAGFPVCVSGVRLFSSARLPPPQVGVDTWAERGLQLLAVEGRRLR